MSSGFVSAGTTDAPVERSDEWLAAQEELEANRHRKAQESSQASGRSLYDTLKANEVAKQEAFEEANKLKNQFRALDEDEIEFLDSVLESTRAEEARVKRETAEGLLVFRRQQEEADKKALEGLPGGMVIPIEEKEEWATGGGARKRKRKSVREKEGLKGLKMRKSSMIEASLGGCDTTSPGTEEALASRDSMQGSSIVWKESITSSISPTRSESEAVSPSQYKLPVVSAAKSRMGLVDYGSESGDD